MMINEWQLWMHPYPTVVKERRYRINRTLQKKKTEYVDAIINLGKFFTEERKPTSPQMKRCVLAIAQKSIDKGMDPKEATSRAFAICTASLQKHGYLKKGTHDSTKGGKKANKSKAANKGHSDKVKKYEKILAMARGE